MATIPQLPFSLHYRNPLFYSRLPEPSQRLSSTKKKKNGFVCFACSIKQTRVRKRVKSNEELRSEIMEFVALNEFPDGHVPSMKELSERGRVDLANVVRRRGYKFIRELVANSNDEESKIMETSGVCLEDSLTEGQGKGALDVVEGSMPLDFPEESDIASSSVEERTSRFIQNGYLDTVDDDEDDIPSVSCPEEVTESEETINGGQYIRDSHGGQRSAILVPNGSAVASEEITYATEVNSSNKNSDQSDGNADVDKDSHDETTRRENQVEITRLRFMLRQKELELSRLKEQIEKEKLSLSVLQRQAETEIQKAQMLVSEKDVELQEAEESLSGLQEVEIEYCGDGNAVEVTGSFNGWEHRVGLELQASKSTGKQKCWSTLLWLYPGTYEIKFIVDSQWITDPKRDSVTRGHLTNNILKVDR